MTTVTTVNLQRKFRFGALLLEDIDPTLEPKDSIKLYKSNFPEIEHAELGSGVLVDDYLEYEVLPLKAGTKG